MLRSSSLDFSLVPLSCISPSLVACLPPAFRCRSRGLGIESCVTGFEQVVIVCPFQGSRFLCALAAKVRLCFALRRDAPDVIHLSPMIFDMLRIVGHLLYIDINDSIVHDVRFVAVASRGYAVGDHRVLPSSPRALIFAGNETELYRTAPSYWCLSNRYRYDPGT